MRRKIAVLGANEPLLPFFIQTKRLGYEIHCFAWKEGAVCKKHADFFYPISFLEKVKILEICKKVGIDGVISFTLESALPTVNFIAQELNLEGNPRCCGEIIENKYTMREQLKKCGISIPNYVCISSKEELGEYEFDYPQIVKPIDSGGSRGVTKVWNSVELLEAYERALGFTRSGKVLVEQFIEGKEFSVEYISHQGHHFFIAITDKVTTGAPFFVEVEHHQPASLSSPDKNAIKILTECTLEALLIYSSASHTEIKMDNKGMLYVIEVGARMGGDMISSDLVRLSTGYDFVKGVLELATGDFKVPQFSRMQFSGIYFLAQETKKVYSFIKQSKNYKQIVDKKLFTEDIRSIKESNDRSGYFIYQADSKFDLDEFSSAHL